jgi:hypothetical protein
MYGLLTLCQRGSRAGDQACALDLLCIINELCVAALQHCSVHVRGVDMHMLHTQPALIHMLLVADSSMLPAALLACCPKTCQQGCRCHTAVDNE